MPSRMVGGASIALVIVALGIGSTVYAVRHRPVVGIQPDGSILVPNGQTLTPAGTHIEINDRPLGMVVSPDGTLLAVATGSNFNPRALHIIDLQTRTLKQTIAIVNSFVGVAFNPAGDTIYVGGGPSNDVKLFKAAGGVFAAAGTIPISGGSQPSGLTLNGDGTRLYVALNQTNEVAVISPYVKRGRVDSSFLSIVNVFRTVEQILGLSPVNQFDAAAEPMFSVFTSKPDLTPYTARPNQVPLDEMNPSLAGLSGLQRQLAKFSLTIDSSDPDSADADTLNRAIWHSVKGFDTPYNYGRPIATARAPFETLLRHDGR
jgi:DNA-binding beta-propeller fold protein YncE